METFSQFNNSINHNGRKYTDGCEIKNHSRRGKRGSGLGNNFKTRLPDQMEVPQYNAKLYGCDNLSTDCSVNAAEQNVGLNRFPRNISSDKYEDKKNVRIKFYSNENFQNGVYEKSQTGQPVNFQVFRGKNRFGNNRRGTAVQFGDFRNGIENHHFDPGPLGNSLPQDRFEKSSRGSITSFYDNRFDNSEKLYRYSGGRGESSFRRGNYTNSDKKSRPFSPRMSPSCSDGGMFNRRPNAHMNNFSRSRPDIHHKVNSSQRSPRKNSCGKNPLGMYWPKLSPLKEGDNISNKSESKLSLSQPDFIQDETNLKTRQLDNGLLSTPLKSKDTHNGFDQNSKSNDFPHNSVKNSDSAKKSFSSKNNINMVSVEKDTNTSEDMNVLAVKLVGGADDNVSISDLGNSPSVTLRPVNSKPSRYSQKNSKSFKGVKNDQKGTDLHKDSKEYSSITAKNCSPALEQSKVESICKKDALNCKDSLVKVSAGETAGTSGNNVDSRSDKNSPTDQKQNNSKGKLNSSSGNKDLGSGEQGKDADARRSPPNNNQRKKKKSKKGPHYSYCIELDLAQSFNEQAKSMVKQFQMTPWEHLRVDRLKCDLIKVFSPIIPNIEPVLFGSLVAGTAFTNSDVDIYLKCFNNLPTENVRDFIVHYGSALNKGGLFRQSIKIPFARVPILKAVHNYTGMSVDISFVVDQLESHYGLCNSLLVKHLCSHDARVRNLIMMILFWAKYHGFVGKYQMSSFTFILLAVFYLQIVEILPPLHKLIRVPENSSTWPNTYDDDPQLLINRNDENLESLYLGFFTFYSEVRFDEVVVSVYAGELVLGVLFESMDMLPECYAGYKRLVEEDKEPALVRSSICIQEPFKMSWNTARSVSAKTIELLKHGCLNVCSVFAKFSSKKALVVVHSNYELTEGVEDSYCWELPCPQSLNSKEWFEKVVKATKTVFSSILLMKINEGGVRSDGGEFCKFHLTNVDEMNPVKLVISSEYMLPFKERKALVKAYKLKDISPYEKEVKASALLLDDFKKKGQKNIFKAIIHVARNEKNGCTEVSVNSSNAKQSKSRKGDHKQFVAFLKNDNFKNFLTLTLERGETDLNSEKCLTNDEV